MQFPLPVASVMLWFWRQKMPASPQDATLTHRHSYNKHREIASVGQQMIDNKEFIRNCITF